MVNTADCGSVMQGFDPLISPQVVKYQAISLINIKTRNIIAFFVCLFMDGDVQCFFNGTLSLSVRDDGNVDAADMLKLYNCSTKSKRCNKLVHS